jgi:aryl-alcohol dehydrogenase-like predicted oxidoreductase
MPTLAFGTWQLEGRACYTAVAAALRAGFRHLDTAQAYMNEASVRLSQGCAGLGRCVWQCRSAARSGRAVTGSRGSYLL